MSFDYMAVFTFIMAWLQWGVEKGIAAFTLAWNTSKKATEIAMVGIVLFAVAIWLGFAHAPKVDAKDEDLTKQVSALSAEVKKLEADIDALKPTPAPITTGSITKPSKLHLKK